MTIATIPYRNRSLRTDQAHNVAALGPNATATDIKRALNTPGYAETTRIAQFDQWLAALHVGDTFTRAEMRKVLNISYAHAQTLCEMAEFGAKPGWQDFCHYRCFHVKNMCYIHRIGTRGKSIEYVKIKPQERPIHVSFYHPKTAAINGKPYVFVDRVWAPDTRWTPELP